MSQIIPPPFSIEFPEQVALSDRIDGTRTDVAASEKAVGELNKAIQAMPDILSGSATPSNTLGKNGDVYFRTGS